MTGFFFVGALAFALLSLAWVAWRAFMRKPVSPPIVASAFLALPYCHHIFARADVSHLAQGIHPFLIGVFSLLAVWKSKIKWPIAVALVGASVFVMNPYHPGVYCLQTKTCVQADVGGDNLLVRPTTAKDLALLKQLSEDFATGDRVIYVAPFWPGAYAVLRRKAPVWEIYPIVARSDSFQQKEIERLEAADPAFAFIIDLGLDGREDLRFSATHPLLNQYIRESFDLVPGYSNNPTHLIYKSKAMTTKSTSETESRVKPSHNISWQVGSGNV